MNDSTADGFNMLSEEPKLVYLSEKLPVDNQIAILNAEANLLCAQNEQKRIEADTQIAILNAKANLLCAQNEQKRIEADAEANLLRAQNEQKRIEADTQIQLAKLNAGAKINTEAKGK